MAIATTLYGEGAGTLTSGQRKFAQIGSARIKPQVIEELQKLNANASPFIVLLEKYGQRKTVGAPTFYHFEGDELPTQVGVTGTEASDDTSIAVESGHGKRLQVNHILRVARTNEMIRVTGISTDQITVVRGHGGSTAAALAANDELHICGMADADGNTAPSGLSSEPTQVSNACQIFKEAAEISGRDINADNYGASEQARILKDAHLRFRNMQEKGFMFNTGISTSDPTMSAGLDKWITTNETALAGSALDEASTNTFIKSVMRRNAGDKKNMYFLAGSNIQEAFDSFGRDNIHYKPDDSVGGIAIGEYRNSFGSLKIVPHGLLDDVLGSGAAQGRWGGRGFLLNMSKLGIATYRNRGENMYSDAETPGTDGKKWYWMADKGLWVALEKVHGRLTGCASL